MVTDTQNTEKKRPAMEVKNVCFSYGKNEILKGASLKIEKGKVTTIMGERNHSPYRTQRMR